MDENRKKLYDQLSANYDMGTFDEFDTDLDNEDNQKVAWEAMGGQDGYGDFSMFQQAIARSPQAAEAETTESTGNTGSAGNTGNTGNTGSTDAATMATAAPMMEAQQPDWTTTASAMPSEDDADADISLPDAPNPNTPKDASAVNDGTTEDKPDGVSDNVEDYSTKSVEELYAGLGLENKEYSDEEFQNELRRSAERIGWISDPVVFEQRKAEFNNSLNELQRRMLVQRAAAQVEQMKPPLAHQEVMPGLDATTAQEIADARNKRFDYLLHGESGKQGSPYTRAVSTQSGWVRSNQLIEQARHKDKSELDEIKDKALNAMSSDPSQRFGSDEEAAIQLAAAMAEEQAQANGGHAKTPSERELEAYYAGPEDTYVEVDGQHDPHEEQLVRQKDAAFRAEVKRHQEGYTHGLRGYATDIEKDPLAWVDCPVYAIPRMVKDMVAKELREKAKERLYTGYQPGLSQMLAFSDDLEANEYDRHLKNAIRIFGPERYEGYVLGWAKKYYTTIANARISVDNMIRNEIINQLGLKPSNNWEYLFGSVLNNTFVTQGLKALYGLEKGTRPDDFNYITAQQAAYRQYEDEHNNDWQDKLTQMTAPALTLVADAVTGGFFLAGKASQIISQLPRLFYASSEAASRSLMNSTIYRIFMANLSGAANFATYEMQSMALQQLATGEYREKHNFWSSLGHAGVSGAAKGMVFGIVGEAFGSLFRGVSGKMVYGVEAGKLLAETATFSAMGYLENGNLTLKDAGTNFGLALSGRVSHAGKLIKDIRSRANNEGIYGRKANYHKISEAEKDALVALGYGDVASALRGENISEPMLRRMQNQLEQMRLDKRVSWETIRCCDWVLNGRLNAVPGVRDKIIEADGKGGYTITAVDANGRAIMGSVHVTGTEARNKVLSSINHEIDKAGWVESESKMQSSLIGRQLVETVREYAESTGEDAEALLKTYMTALGKDFDHKSLEPVETKVYETINALRSGKGQPTDIADTKETIGKRFGVDIDQAIKTEKSQRTKEQRAALAEYQEWLDGREDIIDLHQYRGPAIERPYYGPERGSFERKRELGDDEYTTEVEKWRGGVMLGKVVVVNSLDEVTDAKVRKQIADGDAAGNKSVPGWYDSKTDTAYIYAPHIIDGKDFNETMLHEVVSHKGLRGLLGEADYNKLLDKIWEDMSPSERKALEDYPGGEENESEVERTRRLADEWLAHRAQGVDVDGRNSIWQTAKRHVKDWLRRHGIDVYYSDYELENKLRESYRELAGNGRKTKTERGGEGEPRKEDPIIEGEPEHIHEDQPDDGVVPPDDGGTPPEGVAAPPAAEGGETPAGGEPPVERPTAAVGRVDGTPADLEDWRELMALGPDELDSSQVTEGLSLLEAEREQAHRYANGELADEPSNWDYWAARDGLSAPENPGANAGGATGVAPVAGGGRTLARPKAKPAEPKRKGSLPKTMQNAPQRSEQPGEPVQEPERPALSEKPLNELTAEELDGEITRLMEYFDAGGQDADGSLDRRLSELYAEQSRREAEVKEPVEPQELAEPAEPVGDDTPAETESRPTEPATTEPAGAATADATGGEQRGEVAAQVDEEAERRAAQEADPYYMPMENKGGGRMSPNWRKATAEQIFNHLNDRENESGRGTLDGNIADGVKRAEDKVKDVERREPKGKGRSDAALDKWEKELSEARAQLEKWREVERMRREQKAADGDDGDPTWKQAYDEFNSSDEEPVNLEDYVARHLYGTKFKWKDKELERTGGRTHGLGGHLGLSKSDKERRDFFGWIDEKNGSYPESVAEGLYANMPDWMRERYDTMEVLDAVLSVVGSNPRPRDMVVDYVKRLRAAGRGQDEEAERIAGERGYANAAEMEAGENQREREMASFHDVAAAGRDADGARADLLADAQARLNDPNSSEYEKQAARTVLRYRLRDDRFEDDKEFADAARLYNETQRMNQRRADREGKDYYPTPAPLALIASRLLHADKDMGVLDIGSGDGMLHRYLGDADVTAIESSPVLAAANRENTGATVIEGDFLKMADGKKYERIITNPPYGQKGDEAFRHASKGYDQLADGGRMVAILPMGKNADRLYSEFVNKVESSGGRVTLDMELPSCTFYKAGIHGSRTRMVVVDKGVTGETRHIDLGGIKTNQELYEAIYKMDVTPDGEVRGVNGETAESGGVRFRYRDEERRPTFYSNAERAVENVKQGKATAEQWKAMLTKAGGIKAGEDKWMGLTDWLDEHKGQSLTKDEVLQFVRDNGIRMEEVNYGGDVYSNPRMQELQAEYRSIYDNLKAQRSAAYDEAAAFNNKMVEKYGTEAWHSLLDEGDKVQHQQMVDDFERKFGAGLDDAAMREMTHRYGDDFASGFDGVVGNLRVGYGFNGIPVDAAKYYLGDINSIESTRELYTTRGLENKREIAFVVPGIEPYQQHDEIHFGPENGGRAVMWVRFGEARDTDGKRVLVIDEVQSNRHQDARERGYRSQRTESRDYKFQQAADALTAFRKELEQKYGEFFLSDDLTEAEIKKYEELRAKLDEADAMPKDEKDYIVPDAPFEKNWMEVAMKRMLRLAAEEGFDKVAWTTGEQQAKRYDIGDAVKGVYYGDWESTGDSEVKRVEIPFKDSAFGPWLEVDHSGKIVQSLADGIQFVGHNLSELLGKEIANKVLTDGAGSIEGDGLRIGGEGMKGFYDEILPRFMNKYGKKWGSKVGDVKLSTPGGEVMHSVDVTEPMKESVMQGQPLFRVRRAPNGEESNLDERQYDEVRTDNFKRWFGDWENDPENASKVVDANGEPLVVYHGTKGQEYYWKDGHPYTRNVPKFYTFKSGFFTPDHEAALVFADGAEHRVYATYLDIKRPLEIDAHGDSFEEIRMPDGSVMSTDRIVEQARQIGDYDGVIIRNVSGESNGNVRNTIDDYIPFRPEQIKSATENNGDFSRESGDIRFRVRGEHETGDRVRVRREGMNDGRVRVEGLPGEWRNIDEAGRAMQLSDPEHMYVPSDDGKWLDVYDWRDNEVWDIWRGKPGSKRFEKWRERTLNHIRKQVPEYAKKLGLDVELIEDESAVPAGHENEKSWYDAETGKIHIVVPRHAAFDVSDVMSSLWHEGVSRHGLRKLVGDDNYDTFLDNVYTTSDANIRAEIDRLAEEVTDGDRRGATEEYLSRLAEQMGFQYYKDGSVPVRSWMQRGLKVMRENFDKLCHHLGLFDMTETLRDDDLRAVLYDSYHHLLDENRDAYAAAKRAEREDKEYVKAVKRGDIDTAMTMLHRKLATSEGIVGYAAAHGHGGSHREVSHRLKDSESGAIEQAARDMVQYVPKDAVLVPMPPHEGVVRKDTDTWLLAQELSRLTGAPVVAALRGRESESRYAAKQAGRKGLSADELGFYQDMELPDGKTPVFVDNVVGSGETAKAAVQAMGGRGMTLAYTKGNLGKPTEGLKNVTVTYDDAGNLIPLSERFDRSNSDVRFRVRGDASGETADHTTTDHTTAVEDARRRLESDDASEFERQAARAVINAYGGGSGDTPDTPGGGVRFRTRDDADMLVDMTKHNNDVARQRRDAVTDFVKAITDVDELTDSKFATALGKVMRGQRQYDQDTVADITTMVKAMMDAGLLTELDNFSVKQILTKIKDSTGKNDITAEANKLIDIMLKHQLRRGKRAFEQQLKVKGMRQDSRGVVVQGGLDYHGQRAAKALKEGLSLGDLQAVNDRIDEAEQRLSDPDEVVRGNAADELEGLYIARQYYDEIKQSEINEANIKSQLEQAQADHKNGTLSDEAYKQLRQASNDALRELRCERVDAWARLNEQLSDRQSESAERAKQFREQQKQRQAEIQHWANSDMEGHSADPHEQETRKKSAGNKARDAAQAVLQPLGTFDKLMRYFGNSHPKGEGYLFGFVRRFMNVRDQWFKERKADFDQMDTAARRIGAAHGARVKVKVAGGKIATRSIKDWADVYTYINQQKPLTVTVKGKDYEITQGNATYLLAMEGQADGRMKLRTMGLTEADMDALRGQVDPMLLELSQWVIHGLLPGMRPRLNQTHIRMFGADMTDIPNYFPIRTSELARNETVNLAQQNGKIRPATITGSIIERKRNNLDLDLGADFFQVTAEHIDEMNHWNSFAEFARDLNTLLSYKRFKAQVHNLHSWRYGNGADIWKTLEDTAAITTGDYQSKTSKADAVINGATKGLAAANITFRPYTGLKQLLSAPVYLVQARWDDIGYSLANLKGTWQWAIENLPTFAERWQGRMAGDPILTQAEQERGSQNKKLRTISKWGFAFNAGVDAVTVAIGARAIYRTKYRRYKDMGYSEEQANQKALEDAAISVNETQQSGLGAFTSVIQQDRTFWSRALTIYRNASMGYQRQLVEGLKAMRNGVSAEWRATAKEKVAKKLERDGIDSAMAAKVADRLVNREAMRGVALAAMFGSIAPFVWALGAQYLGYKMAGGDDDEQERKMLGQASTHLLSGWMEGIVFGGQLSSAADFAYDYCHGRKKLRDYSLQRDLVSDMAEQILGKSSGKPADAVYDIVNMIVAMSTGVNPKSIVEPTVGIIDVVQNWGGDAELAHEVALGWCRLLNVPQTSLDQVYVDEIGLSAKDAKQLSAEEFAERWCRYKRRRGAGWMSPLTSAESDKEQEGKLLKRYERMMDERFESLSDERVEQIMESDDELLKKHAAKAYKSRIEALTDDDVQAAIVPLSDSAPQDSIAIKREGIKRAYKSEGMSYDTPSDREKNAQAYERRATMTDIAEDAALKGRRDALKKSVGDEFEKMGAEYKKGSGGWGWYIPDAAKSRADEIHAYKKAHEAELDEYGILSWWFGSSKGSSGYIKKGFTDGKHDADEVMKEYREARKRVLAKTQQR